jgi:hypothetical protein
MDEEEGAAERTKLSHRLGPILDRTEQVYLRLLRATILVIATGLIVYAAILAATSLFKIVRSPDSVVEETASVAPDEITNASLSQPQVPAAPDSPRTSPAQRQAYDQLLNRYYGLFRSRFENYRQNDDHPLSRDEFDDRFIQVQTRLNAIGRGQLDFATDTADLDSLVRVMSDAAQLPAAQQRLSRYRAARRVQVCQNVERTRTQIEMRWNPYGTSCLAWYENGGCSEPRTVTVPYTARECSMRFPEGTQSHVQIFRAFQDRYFGLLAERRSANAARAQASRDDIAAGNVAGHQGLWTTLLVLGGFLVLMFFFLLIAIERHQRRLSGVQVAEEAP